MNRKLDTLGRIVIPMEIRKLLSLNENDLLTIELKNNEIILKKYVNESLEDKIKKLEFEKQELLEALCEYDSGLAEYLEKKEEE